MQKNLNLRHTALINTMLKNVILISLVILMMISCNNNFKNKNNESDAINCNVEFIPQYYQHAFMNNKSSYSHFIYVTNFDKNCFGTINFIAVCKNYLDTVKSNLPVNSIEFISSVDESQIIRGGYAWDKIFESHIVGFEVDYSEKKKNSIIGITFFKWNKENTVELAKREW